MDVLTSPAAFRRSNRPLDRRRTGTEAAEVTQRAGSSTTLGFEDAQKMVAYWRCWRIWTTRRTSTPTPTFPTISWRNSGVATVRLMGIDPARG